jgi:8-oxo-dGTP diphosphatase
MIIIIEYTCQRLIYKKYKIAYTVMKDQEIIAMAKPELNVAIAILLQHTQVLVGFREAHQHQGNKYEFPGGKVEMGERPMDACRREVLEEVGIDIQLWNAFDFVQHEYEDVVVNLHIFQAYVPENLNQEIGSPWKWYSRQALAELHFPKANQRLIQRLLWPKHLELITDLAPWVDSEHPQLAYWLTTLDLSKQLQLIAEVSVEQLQYLVVGLELYQRLNSIQQANVAAVYLEHAQLLQLSQAELVVGQRYLANANDALALAHAQKIGIDAVLLSADTLSVEIQHNVHTSQQLNDFSERAQHLHIPCFILKQPNQAVLVM